VDFRLTEEQKRLQERYRTLAAEFAPRSAEHDRDGTHPTENYQRLREEGFLELNVPKKWGGSGVGLLGHTLAFEALAQGCPSTAGADARNDGSDLAREIRRGRGGNALPARL